VGGDAWTEGDATCACLLQDGPGRPLLHLAAHAEVRLDEPSASFIQLADRPLLPRAIQMLDLQDCRLVTLSACRTGLGHTRGGDTQMGLGRAFGSAGAAAVLAALWPIEDGATRALMQRLYERLAGDAAPAQALRDAQLDFLRGAAQPGWRHPYFWGGFQLMTYARPSDGDYAQDVPVAAAVVAATTVESRWDGEGLMVR
jgi:CHAT domain-containing protein